jgi:hypothetical protein
MEREDLAVPIKQVLAKLRGVRPTRDGWDACCPVPDHNQDGDQNPSLRVTVGEDGRLLLKCRVGCSTDAVLEAAGLEWEDLFPSDDLGVEEAAEGPACPVERPPPQTADGDCCHRVYAALLQQLPLSEEHRQDLGRRGLPDAEIDRRGYGSLRNVDRGRAARVVHQQLGDAVLGVSGFVQGEFGITLQGEATGLLVPVRDVQGRVQAIKIRRASDPKYLYLTGGPDGPSPGSPVHVPLGVTPPAPVVRVTEGELKADVCQVLDGTPTIGVPGVTQWRGILPLLKVLQARTVVLAYDAPDVHTKPPVFEQAEALWLTLKGEGFEVEMEDWYEPAQGS